MYFAYYQCEIQTNYAKNWLSFSDKCNYEKFISNDFVIVCPWFDFFLIFSNKWRDKQGQGGKVLSIVMRLLAPIQLYLELGQLGHI